MWLDRISWRKRNTAAFTAVQPPLRVGLTKVYFLRLKSKPTSAVSMETIEPSVRRVVWKRPLLHPKYSAIWIAYDLGVRGHAPNAPS